MIRPLMHHVLSGQPLNKIKVGEDIENPSIRDCVYFSGDCLSFLPRIICRDFYRRYCM